MAGYQLGPLPPSCLESRTRLLPIVVQSKRRLFPLDVLPSGTLVYEQGAGFDRELRADPARPDQSPGDRPAAHSHRVPERGPRLRSTNSLPAGRRPRLAADCEQRPLVAFVGALGYDDNKGFAALLSAWRRLCARTDWDADLVVAGDGRARELWRRRIGEAGLDERIRLLGFTDRIPDLLAAADLLVSPVRYESYGLNVQEAICCGVPAMVTETAGIAERYPVELRELLIRDPDDAEELTSRLAAWRATIPQWKERVAPFSKVLRAQTPELMAQEIVAIAEAGSAVSLQTPLNINPEIGLPAI